MTLDPPSLSAPHSLLLRHRFGVTYKWGKLTKPIIHVWNKPFSWPRIISTVTGPIIILLLTQSIPLTNSGYPSKSGGERAAKWMRAWIRKSSLVLYQSSISTSPRQQRCCCLGALLTDLVAEWGWLTLQHPISPTLPESSIMSLHCVTMFAAGLTNYPPALSVSGPSLWSLGPITERGASKSPEPPSTPSIFARYSRYLLDTCARTRRCEISSWCPWHHRCQWHRINRVQWADRRWLRGNSLVTFTVGSHHRSWAFWCDRNSHEGSVVWRTWLPQNARFPCLD